MQEIEMPGGYLFREFFSTAEVLSGKARQRRNQLEAQGGKFLRMVWVDRSKYQPHQGAKEMARRVRQAEEVFVFKTAIKDVWREYDHDAYEERVSSHYEH